MNRAITSVIWDNPLKVFGLFHKCCFTLTTVWMPLVLFIIIDNFLYVKQINSYFLTVVELYIRNLKAPLLYQREKFYHAALLQVSRYCSSS